jgi:hypothetical protein
VTQRADCRQRIFFESDEDRRYRGLISTPPTATDAQRDLFGDK